MILCHKCAGLLTESTHGLYDCGCISGWIRGNEPEQDFNEVLASQIAATRSSLELYRGQGRDENGYHIQGTKWRLARLEAL